MAVTVGSGDVVKQPIEIGEWESKVWGRTQLVYMSRELLIHNLETEMNSWCSLHYHKHRANEFCVVSGKIRVVWVVGADHFYTDLTAGQKITIPSLVPHQFQVQVGGQVVELYRCDRARDRAPDIEDIVRLTEGNNEVRAGVHMPFVPGVIDSHGILEKPETPAERMHGCFAA